MGDGVGVCRGGGGGGVHSRKSWSGVGEGMREGVGVLGGGVSELLYVNQYILLTCFVDLTCGWGAEFPNYYMLINNFY